eukprot:scaffold7044_cov216-Pinguiococcus_pyrenoidosus.AAC.9
MGSPRAPEPAFPPLGLLFGRGKDLLHLLRDHALLEHQLRDAHAPLDLEAALVLRVVEQHHHDAAVVGVDDARHDLDAVLQGEAGAWRDAPVAAVGEALDGNARRNQTPLTRRNGAVVAGGEVVARGPGGLALGQLRVLVVPSDVEHNSTFLGKRCAKKERAYEEGLSRRVFLSPF